jgi:hypothetical protein
MRRILLSTLALGLMTSAALAAPVKLTPAQMDGVKAGQVALPDVTGILAGLLGSLGVGLPSL